VSRERRDGKDERDIERRKEKVGWTEKDDEKGGAGKMKREN
jgi:hypothetical protein